MLRIEKITKSFRNHNESTTLFNNITLSFTQGQFVAISGPSGSGKTTLINLLGGLDVPDKGEIIIDGVSTSSFKEDEWAYCRTHKIGFIFQKFNLVEYLTAFENVVLALELSGMKEDESKAVAKQLLLDVGLQEKMHELPHRLSGGEKQRVAIARALANNPDIILADEPTGALDRENAKIIMRLLRKIANSGKLVIMVTHNHEILESVDRVIVLNHGAISSDVARHVSTIKKSDDESPYVTSNLGWGTAYKMAWRNVISRK
ncbi:MAG: ABC transporter ATP-binding protein, partial [Bacilli bacterium]